MLSHAQRPPIGDKPESAAQKERLTKFVATTCLAIAAVFVLATLGFVAARLWYGVDFTDEAFYVAMPYRFALGDVPFRDEQSMGLFAGLFGLPVVYGLLLITGSTDGLVIVMRHAHLLFTIGVGTAVFFVARRWVGAANAAVTAAACLAFAPFTLHGLSYNTLACGFLTIALFQTARAQAGRAGTGTWFWIGLLLALAALVYPTLAVGGVIFMAINFWRAGRERQGPALRAFLIGGCAVLVAVLLLVVAVGLESVLAIPSYMAAFKTQGGGWPKALRVGQEFLARTPLLGALVIAGFIAMWVHRRAPTLLASAMLVIPALLWQLVGRANGTLTLYAVTGVACLGPWFAMTAGSRAEVMPLMRGVWWPSILCGAITGWSSSNGAMNASIGSFPAALCSLVLLQMTWQRHAAGTSVWELVSRLGALATPALFVAMLIVGDYRDYYGEPATRRALTQRVGWGPYKGLATTPARARQLDEFRSVVLPQVKPDDRVIVFDGFPGGYLLFGVPPASNSVWLPTAGPQEDRALTVRYWGSRHAPTLAFITHKAAASGDPLLNSLSAWGLKPVATTELGTLLRRTP